MNRYFAKLLLPLVVLCIQMLLVKSLAASGYLCQAGPMIGHVGESSAVVWLRVKQGTELEAVARQGGQETRPSRVEDISEGFYRLHFAGLKPATSTSVRIDLSRAGDETESEEVSFRTAPRPSNTGTVRIAFGSCSKISQHGGAPIYDAVADENPDFFIFGGDNIYFIVGDGSSRHFGTTGPVGDWDLYESMVARHLRTRIHPDLQRLHRSVPAYATWDDHDYGPNNADSTFPLKEEATRAFTAMWANPAYGTPDTPGIFSSFRHGPVEVFLMDDRTHKYSHANHRDVTREAGTIWGDEQVSWLLAGLKSSTAPVKVIANGTQVISLDEGGEGHYQEAQDEQKKVMEFLAREKIGGLVFLTGDRHYSEAMQLEQPDGTLIVEFTSSPLQQGGKVAANKRQHPNQLWSMRGNSYGLVTVEIPKEGAGTVRFEARDESNQLVVIDDEPRTTTWELEQLNY